MNPIEQVIPKLSGAWYAIRSMVHISNINTQINLLCILWFVYTTGVIQQWEDLHFTKENYQNYGQCTTQNFV